MLLLGLIAAIGAFAIGVIMTTKADTVYPFAPTKPSASDTLTTAADTVFPDASWSVAVLTRLSDVEDLLDYLEMHNVAEREVRVLEDNCFRVRWK